MINLYVTPLPEQASGISSHDVIQESWGSSDGEGEVGEEERQGYLEHHSSALTDLKC